MLLTRLGKEAASFCASGPLCIRRPANMGFELPWLTRAMASLRRSRTICLKPSNQPREALEPDWVCGSAEELLKSIAARFSFALRQSQAAVELRSRFSFRSATAWSGCEDRRSNHHSNPDELMVIRGNAPFPG